MLRLKENGARSGVSVLLMRRSNENVPRNLILGHNYESLTNGTRPTAMADRLFRLLLGNARFYSGGFGAI